MFVRLAKRGLVALPVAAALALGALPGVAAGGSCPVEPRLCRPVQVPAGGPELPHPPGVNTNDYPTLRDTAFIGVPIRGVTSPYGGVIAIEHSLYDPSINDGVPYMPCKAAATTLTNYDDPLFGGEPYKDACQNPEKAGYYRSGPFGGGIAKRSPVFPDGLVLPNVSTNSGCTTECRHEWANRTTRIDVEIYLKWRDPETGKTVTDFRYVRPRFAASSFTHPLNGGLYSTYYGYIRPLKAYERGTARLQGVIYSQGTEPAESGRVRFSVFENEANGRSSTGQPLQAFSVFTSTGHYYSTGTVYAGHYKVLLRDTAENVCVRVANVSLGSMGLRADIHLDRKDFGIPHGVRVPCSG